MKHVIAALPLTSLAAHKPSHMRTHQRLQMQARKRRSLPILVTETRVNAQAQNTQAASKYRMHLSLRRPRPQRCGAPLLPLQNSTPHAKRCPQLLHIRTRAHHTAQSRSGAPVASATFARKTTQQMQEADMHAGTHRKPLRRARQRRGAPPPAASPASSRAAQPHSCAGRHRGCRRGPLAARAASAGLQGCMGVTMASVAWRRQATLCAAAWPPLTFFKN